MGEQALLDDSATRGPQLSLVSKIRVRQSCTEIFSSNSSRPLTMRRRKNISAQSHHFVRDRVVTKIAMPREELQRARRLRGHGLASTRGKGNTAAKMKELKSEMNKILQQNRTLETIDLFAGMHAEELKRVASRLKIGRTRREILSSCSRPLHLRC